MPSEFLPREFLPSEFLTGLIDHRKRIAASVQLMILPAPGVSSMDFAISGRERGKATARFYL
jgi:hypothetical protein